MMESIKLKKGEVHLMEDRLVIEGDGAVNRKNWNLAIGVILFLLTLVYLYVNYDRYVQDPHQFNWFEFILRMFLIVVLIIPSAINRVFRYSAIDEIPYTAIKKHEPAGSLFNWNRDIKLYLSDNKTRMLSFTGDEIKRFRSLLEQKLETPDNR